MVLKFLDFSPLPDQTRLAAEMHTDLNHTTQWKYVPIPFDTRGFSEHFAMSLSHDFSDAFTQLKGNVSRDFPAILEIWRNEQAKSEGKITHAVVVTAYNSTGIFVHDPWYERNRFLNTSVFSSLWETSSGYWAFIIQGEPRFSLLVETKDWFGSPISNLQFTLKGKVDLNGNTDSNGTAEFSDLPIGNYILSYDWRLQSEEREVVLSKDTNVSYALFFSDQTILMIIIYLLAAIAIIWFAITRI